MSVADRAWVHPIARAAACAREGAREGGREGGREGAREGAHEGGREGGREGAHEGGRTRMMMMMRDDEEHCPPERRSAGLGRLRVRRSSDVCEGPRAGRAESDTPSDTQCALRRLRR